MSNAHTGPESESTNHCSEVWGEGSWMRKRRRGQLVDISNMVIWSTPDSSPEGSSQDRPKMIILFP